MKLYQYPAVTNTTTPPEITLVNGTDGQTSDLLGVGTPQYDSTAKRWTVTFTGTGRTGLVIARAALGGHTAEMTIDVTPQTLLLTSDKAASGVSVRYGGESETVQLTLTDAKNKPIAVKGRREPDVGGNGHEAGRRVRSRRREHRGLRQGDGEGRGQRAV